MNLSQNEFISLCKKSLRGKGHHWGVCEDFSYALLALDINKFPVQNILLEVLNTENSKIDQILTVVDNQVYRISNQIHGQFYDPILILGLISVDKDLNKGKSILCYACRVPLEPKELINPKYEEGVSCPQCYNSTNDSRKNNFRERQKQIRQLNVFYNEIIES